MTTPSRLVTSESSTAKLLRAPNFSDLEADSGAVRASTPTGRRATSRSAAAMADPPPEPPAAGAPAADGEIDPPTELRNALARAADGDMDPAMAHILEHVERMLDALPTPEVRVDGSAEDLTQAIVAAIADGVRAAEAEREALEPGRPPDTVSLGTAIAAGMLAAERGLAARRLAGGAAAAAAPAARGG